MTDVATACCVDLCKAATYSPKMKAEGHGLRLLALDLVSALNSRLLDASSPFTNADGMVEIPLMSEALAALCKLDRHFVDTTLLEKCLSRNSFLSFEHGTAFCPSNDPDDMLNWNVNLKELYPAIASSLRHVFMSAVIESNQFHILMRSNSKAIVVDENSQKIELVWALLNLWTQDCKLTFFVPPGRGSSVVQPGRPLHELNLRLASGVEINPDDLEMFVYLTTLLLNNRNPRSVRQAVMNVLRAYHQPSNTILTPPPLTPPARTSAPPMSFPSASNICALLSVMLLLKACSSHGFTARKSVKSFSCSRPTWIDSKKRLNAANKAMALTTAQLTATLQGLPDDGKGLGGRVAQAKRAKLVMRTMSCNSPITDPLWDEALRQWKLLSTLVGHHPFKDAPGDTPPTLGPISGEGVLENTNPWISISGLLTSTAALHDPNIARSLPLDHYIPTDLLHDRFYAIPDRARNVDRYIQEMVDLLVADDLRMREGVKDALGTELHTSLFPILLKHLQSIVAHFFENERATPQSPFSHFIKQAISMLRLFFERIGEPLSEQTSESVSALLIDFVLCELIVNHKDRPPLINNPAVKNQMIDYFLAWATNVNMVSCISAEEASRQRANRDLSMACLKALAAYYNKLKPQAEHSLGRHPPKSHLVHVRLFSRHYDYLTFMLAEVTKLESERQDGLWGLIAARPKGVRTPPQTPKKKGVRGLHAFFLGVQSPARHPPHAARHVHAYNRRAHGQQACGRARRACRACTPVWKACKACTPFGRACRLCTPVAHVSLSIREAYVSRAIGATVYVVPIARLT
ncbi:hypothetical protein PCASD_05356 [Puccinia coronata f. sp. avenae]|uniref:Ras-GAP domain-containing protein n=1 Tax=Puccinia coronata f. sp. avenae TaxID=200324 RepID=A0A2N5UNC3_9BASI|nr:hypothetical protein PCASD_05356 [Puccinia coronata f. sp. avenae]